MREALLSWLPWNIRIIVAIQQASPAWLDLLMRGITYLGSTYFFLVLLPVVYWMRPVPGMQLAVLVLASAYVNTAAKTLLAISRARHAARRASTSISLCQYCGKDAARHRAPLCRIQ